MNLRDNRSVDSRTFEINLDVIKLGVFVRFDVDLALDPVEGSI